MPYPPRYNSVSTQCWAKSTGRWPENHLGPLTQVHLHFCFDPCFRGRSNCEEVTPIISKEMLSMGVKPSLHGHLEKEASSSNKAQHQL